MSLSIIIPTLNEAENLQTLIPYLQRYLPVSGEIIVVDGGSQDGTLSAALRLGVDLALASPKPGRAAQMNHGAFYAKNKILYFVHADTLPPATFVQDIHTSMSNGQPAGSYRSAYDGGPALMRFNAYMTRFRSLFCRGGDQSIYVTKALFQEVAGFREDFLIMEDYDFIGKVMKRSTFGVMPKNIRISARKFDNNSYLRVNVANITIIIMYLMGASQKAMVHTYKRMLKYR